MNRILCEIRLLMLCFLEVFLQRMNARSCEVAGNKLIVNMMHPT